MDSGGGGHSNSHGEAVLADDHVGEATAGPLRVTGAYAPETLGDTAAVYFTVDNEGEADRLLSAEATVGADAQLHETVVEGATSRMQPLPDGLVVPAHGEVALTPGAYHLMLSGLVEPLEPGDVFDLTLTFETAGAITLQIPVRPLLGAADDQRGHGDGHE